MQFPFLITKTQDRTFLQTFKVRIQGLWSKKNTAWHKKVHILDWKLMAHTWLSPLDPCPHDAVGERSALKPSLLFLILSPAYMTKLARYRSCFEQVNPNLGPKHFSATSVNASVNGERESAVLIAHWFTEYRGHQEHEPSLGLVMCSCLWSFVFLN